MYESADEQPRDALSGAQKAAVFLLALDEQEAAAVLRRLSPEAVEEVSREIARVSHVPPAVRSRVVRESFQLMRSTLEGAQSREPVTPAPFAFLHRADMRQLLGFIEDEHPQAIALILAHLPPAKASEVLVGLPAQKQVEVIKRIAAMETTSSEVIREVESALQSRLGDILRHDSERSGGVESVVEMLSLAGRSAEREIMDGLEAEEPELVEHIRRRLFLFEDVSLLDDRAMRDVLKQVSEETLGLALKTASDGLKAKVFANLSERTGRVLREEMQYMGPVRVSDVEQAQQKILDVVRRLEEDGDLVVSARGRAREMLV